MSLTEVALSAGAIVAELRMCVSAHVSDQAYENVCMCFRCSPNRPAQLSDVPSLPNKSDDCNKTRQSK